MATNGTLQPVPTTGEDEIINIINSNFYTLANRIKSLNDEFSYLDLMRIAKIFTSSENNPTTILNNFVSTAWAALDNYAGVYIRLTYPDAYFEMKSGDQIVSGDYVVKLPGNQFLHIPGMEPWRYVPVQDTEHGDSPFIITYELSNEEDPPLPSVNATIITSANIHVHSQSDVVQNGVLKDLENNNLTVEQMRDVRWYTGSGEEVVWTGSHTAVQNTTTLRLNATYIYADAVANE